MIQLIVRIYFTRYKRARPDGKNFRGYQGKLHYS